jgi:O-antigen/teichoic acid export membrane protein
MSDPLPTMSLRARLGWNSLWLLVSRLGGQALLALFTILLARRLGSAGFGAYAFIAAAIFIGNSLTTFGTDMLLMREVAARNDLQLLSPALLLQLAFSGLFITLVWTGAGPLMPLLFRDSPSLGSSTIQALRLYSLALLPLAFYTVFSSALRGREHMDSYALLGLVSGILQAALAGLMPGLTLPGLALGLLLIQVAVSLLAGLLCSLRIPDFWKAWHFRAQAVPDVLRLSAPIGLLGLLTITCQKLSIGLVSVYGGAALTGWFAAAQRVVEACKSLHVAVFSALYPAMAREQAARPFRGVWAALLAGAALAALALDLLAAPLVNLLFGTGFSAAIPALRILGWILLPYTLKTFLSLALVAGKQELELARALGLNLLALLALNLWLTPRFGLVGAAWAALGAESLQAGLLLARLKNIHWLQARTSIPFQDWEQEAGRSV